MITWKDIADDIPQGRGETVHIHHCKTGRNNDRLYITRHQDGSTILAHCFHCGKSRRFSSLKQAGKLAIKEARESSREEWRTLENSNGDELRSARPRGSHSLYRAYSESEFEEIPEHCCKWFESAGLTEDEVEAYGLGYHPHSDRAVLPIFDVDGELEVFQLRRLKDDGSPKYLTVKPHGRPHKCSMSPIINSSRPLLVVVEDILSAIKVERAFPAFPMLGTSLVASQIDYITSVATEVFVWTDFDNPMVRKSTYKLVKQLGVLVPTYLIATEKDPKYYSAEEIFDHVSRARSTKLR